MKPSKILIVDDDPRILNALEATLKPEYNVFSTSSGQDALAMMKEEKDIALAISDQKMGGMTGIGLMEELARRYPDTVRMLITGYAADDLFMNAINVGHIYGFITKPWEVNELRAIVRKGIGHYEKTRILQEPRIRTLLHSGILSMEQLESALRANEAEGMSMGEIFVNQGIVTRNELNTAMIVGDSEQKDLAEVLMDRGIVSQSDLEMAREQQQHEQKSLTETLVEMGYVDEDTILSCYAVQLEMPYVPLPQFPERAHVAKMLPSGLAYEHTIVPVDSAGQIIVIATAEPLNDEVKASIEAKTGRRVMTILTKHGDIKEALEKYYKKEPTTIERQHGKHTEQTNKELR